MTYMHCFQAEVPLSSNVRSQDLEALKHGKKLEDILTLRGIDMVLSLVCEIVTKFLVR